MAAKGIYSALSGAIAQSQRLDTIANNMANANTSGFKKDMQTFKQYLTSQEKEQQLLKVPRVPASVESFYDMQGLDQAYVDASGSYTDFSQGGLKATGNPLDIAIEGSGFFEVATPSGLSLGRKGNFSIDGNGILVTTEGYPVLSADNPTADTSERVIKVDPNLGKLAISEDGSIFQGENYIAQLSLVDVVDKSTLKKMGNSLYQFNQNAKPELVSIQNPQLKQGFLETSNVNIVQEMTDMIAATRAFETNQKAISAYDSIADKLVNQVAKV